MSWENFESGSLLHGIALATCIVLIMLTWMLTRRWRGFVLGKKLEKVIGVGCLIVWIINTIYWNTNPKVGWEQRLPLHYCNMANLIGFIAVMWHRRHFQALIYFWAFALCIWAFITPTVQDGPAYMAFWIFWIYHLFIFLAVLQVLVGRGFRPTTRDLRLAILTTAVYTALLAVIDAGCGWNYGFVGPSSPESPTPIDQLGPYPLRILWMGLLAAGLFALLWLPCRKSGQAD